MRKHPSTRFFTISVLEKCGKFYKNHTRWSTFLNIIAGLKPAIMLKNVLHRAWFFNTFWNFSRTDILKNHCGGILPYMFLFWLAVSNPFWGKYVSGCNVFQLLCVFRLKTPTKPPQNLLFTKVYPMAKTFLCKILSLNMEF